ncbi:MAG: histidine phosphatase family protein [Leptolyngbyaceae cyanobacterium]
MAQRLKPIELFLASSFLAVTAPGVIAAEPVDAEGSELSGLSSELPADGGEGGEGGYSAEFEDQLEAADLVDELRRGGYVIYFRHAQTEKDYADQADPSIDLNDCSTQRALSEYGWRQSAVIGAAFENLDIPVGDVITSQYCRAWQTAFIAFGEYEKTPALNFFPAEEYTDEQFAFMRSNVMPYLTAMPPVGVNTILVGHDDVFESATGIYPEPQGMAYVVKPDGNGGFDLVANMTPEDWALIPD